MKRLLSRNIVLAALLVMVVAVAVRLPTAGDFMTVDEQNWLLRSADFWHQLFREHNPAGTFLTTHPGATVNWLAGAGIVFQEQRLGFDLDVDNLQHFRRYAIAPLILAAAVAFGLITILAARLASPAAGITVGLLAALEPYFVGMNQIVHLDLLLAAWMAVALLALLTYVREHRSGWLVLATIAFGLSLGIKLLIALWLIPMVGAVMVLEGWRRGQRSFWRQTVASFATFVIGGFVLLAVLWPALLTQADFQVGYLARDAGTVITDEHVALEIAEDPIQPWTFYGRTLLARITPVTLLIIFVATVATLWQAVKERRTTTPVWLLIYAVGFLVGISLVAKKGDRYALPGLFGLVLLAGWWIAMTGPILARRLGARWRAAAPAAVVLLAGLGTLLWAPYTIAYNNPLFPNVRPLSQQGWGEGLDAAAAWLNERPDAERLAVASWYPSVMRAYFVGDTYSLSSRNDYRATYLVTYRNMGGRAPDEIASNVLDEVKGRQPVHTVTIRSVPYANIYTLPNVGRYLKHVGELLPGMEIGQVVPVNESEWSSVDIGFATFSDRPTTADVVLHVRESLESTSDIRAVRVPGSELLDNQWHTFSFDPIADSAGRDYYVAVTVPNGAPGNTVTVRYTDRDVRDGQMIFRAQPLRAGERLSNFRRSGDIALRLPPER